MSDGEIHATRKNSSAEYTFATLFAIVLAAEILGLVIIQSYVLFKAGGPSTFGTLRTVWTGGVILTGVLLVVELLS